ncbi:MAG: response regulator [Eggerthellaceae bacterium]
MRMLLVEDDAAIVASLTDLLRSEGYETRCADGQDAAVELLRSERFDLALVDVALAQGNGFAVCAAAKACDPAPAVISSRPPTTSSAPWPASTWAPTTHRQALPRPRAALAHPLGACAARTPPRRFCAWATWRSTPAPRACARRAATWR